MFTDEDITKLSDDDINNRISDLYKRLSAVANLPMKTQALVDQLYNLVDMYQNEQARRMDTKIDTGVVLDTDKMPEKKQAEATKKEKATKVIKPSNFNKVYKNKKEE